MNKPLRSIGGVVAQGSRVASPELIEAMKGRARQLWLRLVIGVLIAYVVGPSLGVPLTIGWFVAWCPPSAPMRQIEGSV